MWFSILNFYYKEIAEFLWTTQEVSQITSFIIYLMHKIA